MTWWQWFLASLMIFVCLFLMLVILIQRGRGSGLAGAFGGSGGSSAFGAKTGDVLTWATVVITAVFLFLAIVLNFKFDESPKPIAAVQPADVPETPATQPGAVPDPGTGNVKVTPLDGPPAGLEGASPEAGSTTGGAGAAETTPPPIVPPPPTTGESGGDTGATPSKTKEEPDP